MKNLFSYITFCIVIFSIGCSNVFSQQEKDYKQMMRKAVNNDNLNLALQIYAAAQEDDYYDLESLQRIQAEIYYRLDDYEKSLNVCKKLYDEDESSTLVNIIYMCVLSRQGFQYDSLICEIATKTNEDTFEKNILQTMSILSTKDIDRVTDAINRWIDKHPKMENEEIAPLKTMLTIMYYNNNRYTDAYNSSIDYLTMDNDCVLYYILGVLRERRQEYSSAISFFTMAIKNGYNHYDAYLQRAICKGWEKDYISSNRDLDTCLAIDSNYYVFYLKGVNYSHLYLYQDAILNFDYALTLNDTFAEGYNYRGVVSANLKEYQFAVMDFKRALSLNARTSFAHNNLGMAYEQMGKLYDAMEEYKLSTKYEPYFEGGWYNLGRLYTDFGLYSKAIKCLKKVIDIDPEISDTYYLLGVNYQNKEDKIKACQYYMQALELQHTKAQEKIDNYCNKEEIKEDEIKNKGSKSRDSYYEDDDYEDEYEDENN